jgi:SAM-dependent methyltransferase
VNWTIERLTELTTAYWPASAVSAALDLGLFEAVDGPPRSAAEIAAALETTPRHTEGLLDALAGVGLIEKREGRYRLDPGAVDYLSRSGPCCLLDALRYNAAMYPLWGRLATCVREGRPVVPPAAHLGGDPEQTRRFVLGMHSRALAVAPAVVPALDLRGARRLLDVGAGPGTFSVALAERYPGLCITLLDLPPVLAVTRELVGGGPAADRISFHPADYRCDPLPSGYAAVLFCGALHQEDAESAARVMAGLAAALEPGGRLFVVDMMLEPTRTAPVFSALFALNMMLVNPSGRVFTGEEVCGLAGGAGLAEVDCRRLAGCPYWVVTARKPDGG